MKGVGHFSGSNESNKSKLRLHRYDRQPITSKAERYKCFSIVTYAEPRLSYWQMLF